jgi:hypothetical protein
MPLLESGFTMKRVHPANYHGGGNPSPSRAKTLSAERRPTGSLFGQHELAGARQQPEVLVNSKLMILLMRTLAGDIWTALVDTRTGLQHPYWRRHAIAGLAALRWSKF